MRIVLPGALPDPREAQELLPHLLKAAPNLVKWLERSHALRIVADPAQTHCTVWEYWRLQQYGFKPEGEQRHSAGLGPLLANGSGISTPDEPIWLLELTHISPSRDGAVLIPANDLALTRDHSDALFEAAQSLFANTGFSIAPCSVTHWRVALPDNYAPVLPSAQLVSTTTVNEWWRQDLAGRPWRRLANELQMLWFDHPVNQERHEQGQVPVNSVWLFGGAHRSQFDIKPDVSLTDIHRDDRLLGLMYAQDWGRWLQSMGELDTEVFASLNSQSEVTLIGRDQFVTHTTENRFWKHWLPGSRESWKKWWSPQN